MGLIESRRVTCPADVEVVPSRPGCHPPPRASSTLTCTRTRHGPAPGVAVRCHDGARDAGSEHRSRPQPHHRRRQSGRRAFGRVRPHASRRPPGGAVPEGLQPAGWSRPGRPWWGPRRRRPTARPERVDPIVRARSRSPSRRWMSSASSRAPGSDYIKFMVDDGSARGPPRPAHARSGDARTPVSLRPTD